MTPSTAAVIEIPQDAQDAATAALSVPEQARALVIASDADLARGNEILLTVKDLRKQIADTFDGPIKRAHEAHKAILAAKQKAEAPLIEAEGIVKPLLAAYVREQERKRREEEDRIRRQMEKEEEERRLAAAVEAEQEGAAPEEVEAIVSTPMYVPPVVAPPPPKLEGVSIRKVVKFEVTDLRALVAGIAAGTVPLEAVQVNTTVVGAMARSLRGSMKWPGVMVWEEDSVAAGRR